MSVILALDPGYLCTRIGVSGEGGRKVREVPSGVDPFAAGEALAGAPPSIVVLPGGPPAPEYEWHPRNVAIESARTYCAKKGIPCVIVQPDGPADLAGLPGNARLSGFPGCLRSPTFYGVPEADAFVRGAESVGVPSDKAGIVVVYLGEEVSVSARLGGKVVDSSDPAACEGPFGFASAGTPPSTAFVSYAASSGLPAGDLRDRLKRGSGAFAYAGVDSVESLIAALDDGNARASRGVDGMAYQVSKEIGRQIAALHGKADCVVMCGPGAAVGSLVKGIKDRVRKWAEVLVIEEDLVMPRLFLEGTKALSPK